MSLVAQPGEHAAAVRDDVVRVDAVEPGCGCRPDERRLREQRVAAGVQRRLCGSPVGDGQFERAIDVERSDPVEAKVGDVGERARHGSAGVRLEMDRDVDPVGPRGGGDERQT